MECIDSSDITIRVQALNLVQGMVSSDNLVSIVSRLMRQLKGSVSSGRATSQRHEMHSDSDVDAENIDPSETEAENAPPLPDDYKIDVIGRILAMCSWDNYTNIVDFEWYIDILTQLVRMAPTPRRTDERLEQTATITKVSAGDVSENIGSELRNVAVKVKAIRPTALNAAELILRQYSTETIKAQVVTSGSLRPVAWIVGEYSDHLRSPEDTLGHLLQLIPRAKHPDVLASCLQAVIKIFALVTGSDLDLWTSERKAKTSLLLARIIHVLEPLALHPNLEVQERAVEFTELLRLTSEAVSEQKPSTDEVQQDPPLLLTQAIPSLFTGWELNSVAVGAQSNVPLPEGLDLDEPIHPNLAHLLARADDLDFEAEEEDEFEVYYRQRPPPTKISSSEPAINRLAAPEEVATSYQASEESYLDADILARRKAERAERYKDDPFYIQGSSSRTGTSTPIHNILQTENGPDLDIDSIPVMQLDLDKIENAALSTPPRHAVPRAKPRQRIVIAQDENLAGGSGSSTPRNYESENNSDSRAKARAKKLRQSLLQVDSSNIGSLSLEGGGADAISGFDYEIQKKEEAEMAQAVKEVERLRLEMQRANERIHVAQGVDVEGTVVKKKKKKVVKPVITGQEGGESGETAVATQAKKKKKKAASPAGGDENGLGNGDGAGEAKVKPKKKKKPRPAEIQDAA